MADQDKDKFYLWHLVQSGVISPDGGGWDSHLWTAAAGNSPVKVAIIDSGLDTGHPNLSAALAAPQIDFQTRLYGAVYDPVSPLLLAIEDALDGMDPETPKAAETVADAFAQLQKQADDRIDLADLKLAADATASAPDPAAQAASVIAFMNAIPNVAVPDANLPSLSTAVSKIQALKLNDLAADLAAENGPEWEIPDWEAAITLAATSLLSDDNGVEHLPLEDPSRFFGAHGTAAAGIVGGRPPSAGQPQHPFFSAMPYYGANPFCEILSYATPYSHEIKPCIHALLAAYLAGAKVIYIPRGLPDVVQRGHVPLSKSRATRIDDPEDDTVIVDADQAKHDRLVKDGELFDALLRAISEVCYIVLAAGNEGYPDRVAYPASQQLTDSAESQQAIIVGAMNFDRHMSAYSNGADVKDRLLVMFSDDSFALDSMHASIDTRTREGTDFDYTPHYPPGAENTFSPWAPLSLDVRGSYGYAASSNIDPPESDTGIDRGSLYTLFGGTSAASALAAGTIALLIQAGKLSADTPAKLSEIKQVMTDEGLSFDPQ